MAHGPLVRYTNFNGMVFKAAFIGVLTLMFVFLGCFHWCTNLNVGFLGCFHWCTNLNGMVFKAAFIGVLTLMVWFFRLLSLVYALLQMEHWYCLFAAFLTWSSWFLMWWWRLAI